MALLAALMPSTRSLEDKNRKLKVQNKGKSSSFCHLAMGGLL